MKLSSIIKQFESGFLAAYPDSILPSHQKALAAMKHCRSEQSPLMRVDCTGCGHKQFVPHSCGHRNCPHCQHHESQ